MTPQDFLASVVRPALIRLSLDGPAAEQILMGTAAQESRFRDVAQEGGPALGYFQIEPATHQDLWDNWLKYKGIYAMRLQSLLPAGVGPTHSALIACPAYAAGAARLLYMRAPGAIPTDLAGQAAYYKAHYNTPLGAATAEKYMASWDALVAPFAADFWPD